jgi:hypothetical protein
MITRFRIEGEGKSRDELSENLLNAVGCVIGFVNRDQPDGEWECTQEVSVMNKGGDYSGRMVMKFHPREDHA